MTNLLCLNDIITDNLAIYIDLTELDSWNLNTGLTSISLTKWKNAVSDDINLIDYGLTEFDNGRTNKMYEGIVLTPGDTKFIMDRVGYNQVTNPTSGETSGSTVITKFDLYPITGVTASTGNYFNLNGGYLQGFFKLFDYNYELLSPRFNNGVTVETILYIQPNSMGIFYMMGARSEDKYNPYFSGETQTGITKNTYYYGDNTGNGVYYANDPNAGLPYFSGVTASEGNTFESFTETEVNRKAFAQYEDRKQKKFTEPPQIDNLIGNIISFELTSDKKLAYKYIDGNGHLISNTSPTSISTTGWVILAMSFIPDDLIPDLDLITCYPRRTGKLIMYVNGRAHWILHNFPEYYFTNIINHRDLQIGVPYSISWGGGSFGLKHSWHYDYQTYSLYNNQNTQYINSNFKVKSDPIPTACNPNPSNNPLSGFTLTADTISFHTIDECSGAVLQEPVMRITYTGATGNTGSTYFIEFIKPICVLSNRDYLVSLDLFNDEFFKTQTTNGTPCFNKVSIIVSEASKVDITQDTVYYFPIDSANLVKYNHIGLHPFPDKQQFEYLSSNILYYGATGIPVSYGAQYLYGSLGNTTTMMGSTYVTGVNDWKALSCRFRTHNNTGKQFVHIGILIETDYGLNQNKPLFVNNFTYTAQDILVQDNTNKITMIEDNFNNSYIGRIQKLRIYDKGLTSAEILHNAIMESKLNTGLGLNITKGGRIITR